MWTTVVLLGLAVSIEPARVGLIALLLTRPRPIRHLFVFLCTGLTVSLSVGFAVLFIFHHSFLGKASADPALIQIGIGVVALLLGAVLASNIPLGKFSRREMAEVPAGGAGDGAVVVQAAGPPSRFKRLTTRVREFARGESSWFSGSIGAALAMPSVDYMALLALIIASKVAPIEQAVALVTFLLLASWAAVLPLLSFLVAPGKTRVWVQRFNEWIRTRTRRHAGAFVAVVGLILIGVGLHGL
ncbi:GAP family protein [Mycobacterium sp. CVI_P3]|uniref:GAP family protein n=1 Tax=Mycobacterium pinniadriaticum TaxID=2994102 RepID=A0ABT3SB44_9MYCO|nr:GAP family protein [Mycobacterium pinniadriaticum]MCX2930202.1 GAP family protein [Mycobacterium pinniadriaticum]MCX2936736.1 GAP family protein [Mycobacterium pinniadriaticum]